MEALHTEYFEGFKNSKTFNVATWLTNDSFLHQEAMKFINTGYLAFVDYIRVEGGNSPIAYQTPDQVEWSDSEIDVVALDRLLSEF